MFEELGLDPTTMAVLEATMSPQGTDFGKLIGIGPQTNEVAPQSTNYANIVPSKALAAYNAPEMQKNITNYLTSMGVSPTHIKGMLANIAGESGFNPRAIGDQGTSIGLFQHHAERAEALKKHSGGDPYNWQKQLSYALSEPGTQQYLKTQFRTPQEASEWFTKNWERPANANQVAIDRIMKYFGGGQKQTVQPPPKPKNFSLGPPSGPKPDPPIPIEFMELYKQLGLA